MDMNSSLDSDKQKQMLRQGAALGGGLLLILALIGVYLFTRPAAKPEPVDTVFTNSAFTSEAVVQVTSEGFLPSTLTVSPHTRVKFENKDSVSHVISLNNPSQQDSAATDEQNDPQLPNNEEIPVGGDVDHVFEKRDTFIYHDQASPTANVSITVK